MFQSTRPRGARHGRTVVESAASTFQSTRPRGARRNLFGLRLPDPAVSIHAPAWGATSICLSYLYSPVCFNPRARVGRDSRRGPSGSRRWCFNPRARVGRDQGEDAKLPGRSVSIHAPAWGATLQAAQLRVEPPMFQSTRPRGARRVPPSRRAGEACFNPRARVGRDLTPRYAAKSTDEFQSTRPRGARLCSTGLLYGWP